MISNNNETHLKFQNYTSLLHRKDELANHTLIFHLESALLKSTSLFPYFMLAAIEGGRGGSILRAIVLFLLYPLICLVSKDMGLKIMVFMCFFGVQKDKFRLGTSVLPKFFLEDVGLEGFDVVKSCKKKIATSDLPLVMVEGFLNDYLCVDGIVGRELKVVNGYFSGFMENKRACQVVLTEIVKKMDLNSHNAIGFGGFTTNFVDPQVLENCKEIYYVTDSQKKKWQNLPRTMYPKPLIFHDGRLAFKPTPLATLAMFMWMPFGLFLCTVRMISGICLPHKIYCSILALTGMRNIISLPNEKDMLVDPSRNEQKGTLYVCNHRTLLDPLFISLALLSNSLTVVTYSTSKFNDAIGPIKTIQLSRDKDRDREIMVNVLRHGDLAVCPEGTTCREPYLLRFSPLFAEVSDRIVPVAIDVQVTMFYGTTASGLKCLDSVFQLMNPYPTYNVKILEELHSSWTCGGGNKSRIEVANHVQGVIAKATEFECTRFTRKDKYMTLACNSGTAQLVSISFLS